VSDEVQQPKEHAKTQRRVGAMYRALAVVGREQTAELLTLCRRVAEGKSKAAVIKPVYAAELRQAIKHAMAEAFKEGRRGMEKKIATKLQTAPASVREAITPGRRVLAAVRELDADALRYREVAAEYDKWADKVVGGRLGQTVKQARSIVTSGVREGVPWQDYDWDKKLGRYTSPGLRSQLGKVFEDYETWQIYRVAVTEHTRAVGLGDVYAIDRDDLAVGGIWVVEYKGCPVCLERDGRTFETRWLRANYPAHPHCMCSIDPAFEWEGRQVLSDFQEAA